MKARRVIGFLLRQRLNDDQQMAIEVYEQNSSDDSSQDDVMNREGNRADNDEEAKRRTAERQLLRDNNLLGFSNIEAITQRLGSEAAERFRSMIENRREEHTNRVLSRFNMTWLRNYITDPQDLDLLDESNSGHLKTIINWYGSSAGLLLIRLNNTGIKSMKISYKVCSENKIVCLSKIISKIFPSDSLFEDEKSKMKYFNSLYNCFPNVKTILKYKNYSENELVIIKLMIDSSAYILKLCDGPFFHRYRNDLINTTKKFYSMLHKIDKETPDGAESKISKTIKRSISKAIIKLGLSSTLSKELKSRLFFSLKNKEIIKYYKDELQKYEEISSIKEDQIYT